MRKPPPIFPHCVLVSCLTLLLPATAQEPNTLLRSIPSPLVGLQSGAHLGYSIAMEGSFTVVGAPYDDFVEHGSGVVKVFDSASGALLHLLPNPNPAQHAHFGVSVAISGTRVVTNAPSDATGARGAYVFDLRSAAPTVPVAILHSPSTAEWASLVSSVAISGTRVVVGAPSDSAGAGSAYVYDLASETPSVPVGTLLKPGTTLHTRFGCSVAISGTHIAVGAEADDTGAPHAGRVYIYDLASGTPTVPRLTLNNPDPAPLDSFGTSLAIFGTRLVVGTPFNDGGAVDAGSAYLYDLAGGTPTVPIATFLNPGPARDDRFGLSVAISGTQVMVGAETDDAWAADAGAAYIYDIMSPTPTVPVVILLNPSPAPDDRFGSSVALSGTQAGVGAEADDTGAADAGTAYLYELASGTPTVPVATLWSPGPAAGDQFGSSVAISGGRMAVGARGSSAGATNAGSAYVYDLNEAAGVPTILNNPTPIDNGNFGSSVAISTARVAVGAPGNDTGSVYVYDLTAGTPTLPVAALNNPNPAEFHYFGGSVAISGTRVVVGTETDNLAGGASGGAYVFDMANETPTVPVAALFHSSQAPHNFFGFTISVAISGTQLVVGADGDNSGAGSARVYDLASATPTVPTVTLLNPNSTPGDRFSHSVAISGTLVVVGSPFHNTSVGRAYVYDLAQATPAVPVAILTNPSQSPYTQFGSSVAISGTLVLVTAFQDNTGATSAGSAYVYDLSGTTPTLPVATLNNPSPAAYDFFGASVAINGMTLAIGAPYEDSPQADKGAVYIFAPNPLDEDSDGLLNSWELTYWFSTAGHGPLGDFDDDGYVELLELAFGLNPTISDAGGLPPVVIEGGYLTMTITKHPGVTYEVQSAGSLLAAEANSFSPATTTVLSNTATWLKVRDNVLVGTSPARLMRVKVTAAP